MLNNGQQVCGLGAAAVGRPVMNSENPQVLKFRPRTLAKPSASKDVQRDGDADGDLSRYERAKAQPDDYRHRMLTNLAAIVFTALLTGMGIWLAMKLADMRNTQDCVLMGRRDCAHISSLKD